MFRPSWCPYRRSKSMDMSLPQRADASPLEDIPEGGIVLQKLSVRHRQAMALLAQGIDRTSIAQLVDYTPEYITWLTRQPLCRAYLKEMGEHVGVRLDALLDRKST